MQDWQSVANLYESLKPQLQARFPEQYFLVHVESGLAELGTPNRCPENMEVDDPDGSKDAWRRYKERHGVMYGEYFAVTIPIS